MHDRRFRGEPIDLAPRPRNRTLTPPLEHGTAIAIGQAVKVVLAMDGERISPVLDAARSFAVVSASADGTLTREEAVVAGEDQVAKAKGIAALGAGVLICGTISWPLEALLVAAGMRVVPNTCGPLDEVAAAYFGGALTEDAFLLPGCPGRAHRHRHRQGRRRRGG